MKLPSTRLLYFIGFFLISCLLGMTFYLQNRGINPCPLCMLQRIAMTALGFIFLLGVVFNPKRIAKFFLGLLALLFSLTGILFSGKQVWLQYYPSTDNSGCEASIQYLFQVLPFDQALLKMFQGGAECSEVGWKLLHLSLAEWSFLWFLLFVILSLIQMVRKTEIH